MGLATVATTARAAAPVTARVVATVALIALSETNLRAGVVMQVVEMVQQ